MIQNLTQEDIQNIKDTLIRAYNNLKIDSEKNLREDIKDLIIDLNRIYDNCNVSIKEV